jgi:CelD/BcsL family acetyltransferase involved in cellulose biosynthesis
MQVGAVERMALLGPEWDAVLATGPGLQSGRAWFEATQLSALSAGAAAHVVTVHEGGRPVAILPLQVDGHRVVSLTSPYTTLFQPLLAPGADAMRVGEALGRYLRRWPLVRLEAMDPEWPGLPPLLRGMRRAGMVPARFEHFGNWSEPVAGLGWPGYLAARPGALRETIRRRTRALERDGTVRFEVVAGMDGLGGAIAAYESVYARSWKVPEPFPLFNQTWLPLAAGLGVLRLGVMWQGAVPIAAQYWVVADGVATVLKLAHDDAAKALSPGTLLTAHMIRHVMERDDVSTLDFGRGDDAYKQQWTTQRRQRVGVMLANPLRTGGLLALARHGVGWMRRGLIGRAGAIQG